MFKYLFLFISLIFFHSLAFAQNSNDFESELRFLENSELQKEDNQMQAVEHISDDQDMVQDTVSSGMSSIKKESTPQESLILPDSNLTPKKRRIRSR